MLQILTLFQEAQIVKTGTILRIGDNCQESTDPRCLIRGWCKIRFSGVEVKILERADPSVVKRQLMKIVHPDLNLRALRPKSLREVSDKLIQTVLQKAIDAGDERASKDRESIKKKIRRKIYFRHVQRNQLIRHEALQQLHFLLAGPLIDLEDYELLNAQQFARVSRQMDS